MPQRRCTMLLVVILIAIAGCVPIAGYWYMVGCAPTVTPQRARELLADPSPTAVLVDVRPAAEFAASHLSGSVNWPIAEVHRLRDGDPVPSSLAGKQLLLICRSGWTSARAALRLRGSHQLDAFSVRGGIQEWSVLPSPACPIGMSLAAAHDTSGPESPPSVMFRPSPRHEQWAAVLTGFGVKPAYMVIALVLAVVLRRRRELDLVSLRWGLLFFFIGEAFCAANYLLYSEGSDLFEHLHCFGMVLTFAFTAYAAMEAIDLRLIHYSHPQERCAVVALCHGCIKHTDSPCGLRRVFLWLIPATVVLALLPLCAEFRSTAYTTRILGTQYSYIHKIVHQKYEIRYLPLLAIIFFAVSWLVLVLKERHPVQVSKLFYAAGLGALGFSLFRLMLLAPFFDNLVWFAFWEEITELLYVVAVAVLLVVFRRGLFLPGTEKLSM